jgi:hypothetical protein
MQENYQEVQQLAGLLTAAVAAVNRDEAAGGDYRLRPLRPSQDADGNPPRPLPQAGPPACRPTRT